VFNDPLLLSWLYGSLLVFDHFSVFLNLFTVCSTPWTGDQPASRPLPTHRHRTQNKHNETFMLPVGLEHTTPVFERVNIVNALDRVATYRRTCPICRRIVSPGMLRRVALVKTYVSKEPGASFIRVTRIGELGTTQAATSNRRTQRTSKSLAHSQHFVAC
jgi:hypothetical protein